MAIIYNGKAPNTTAPALVNSTTINSGSFSVTAGDMIICALTAYRGGSTVYTPVFSDTQSNIWYTAIVVGEGSANFQIIKFCYASATGSITVTATASGTQYMSLSTSWYSGVTAGLTAASATNSNSGTGTTANAGSVAPSGNYLVVAVIGFSAITITPGSGYTELHEYQSSSYMPLASEYQIGSGTLTPNWTMSGSVSWGAGCAAFVEAGGGGTVKLWYYYQLMQGGCQ